jgi:hypothetical protein
VGRKYGPASWRAQGVKHSWWMEHFRLSSKASSDLGSEAEAFNAKNQVSSVDRSEL